MMRTCPPWVRPQLKNGIETQETSMDIQIEMEAQSLSNLSRQGGGPNQVRVHLGVQEQPSLPRTHTKTVLDVLYMDGKIISKNPMAQVSGPNSLGVDGNHRNKGTSRICHGAATPSLGLLAHVSCWGTLCTWLGGYAHRKARGLCTPQQSYNQ